LHSPAIIYHELEYLYGRRAKLEELIRYLESCDRQFADGPSNSSSTLRRFQRAACRPPENRFTR
jgi:hypothetical protein